MQEDKNRGIFEQQDNNCFDSEEEKVWSEEEEETRPRTRPRYLSNPKCQYVGGKIVKGALKIAIYLLVELLIVKFP